MRRVHSPAPLLLLTLLAMVPMAPAQDAKPEAPAKDEQQQVPDLPGLRERQAEAIRVKRMQALLPQLQAPAPDPAELRRLIDELNHDDWTVRAQAQHVLSNSNAVTLRDIEEAFRAGIAPGEQHERLRQVGLVKFAQSPRGAMGVQFGAAQGQAGVTIGQAIRGRGFDSERVLQPRDVVRSIAGAPVSGTADARTIIVSYDPGDVLALELVRNGELMLVEVRLGDFSWLDNTGPLPRPTLEAAWDARLRRLGQPTPPPIAPPLAREEYDVIVTTDLLATDARSRALVAQGTPGESRLDVAGAGSDRAIAGTAAQEFALNAPRDFGDASTPEAQLARIERQIQELHVQLRDPIDAMERQGVINRIAQLEQMRAQQQAIIREQRRLQGLNPAAQ